MVRVKFNGTASRKPEVVIDANTRVADFLRDSGATMSANFSLPGVSLSQADLDGTFNDLISRGLVEAGATVTLYETIKTANANA